MTFDPPKSISEFLGSDAELRILVKKHFPEESYERNFLLFVAAQFALLWNLHFSLERTLEHVDLIRSIGVPDERAVVELAVALERISGTPPYDASAQSLKRASEVLHIWYRLYPALDRLAEQSRDFRFGVQRPAGEA